MYLRRQFTKRIPLCTKADRQDPRSNKSLAIREIVAKMPKAKAAEITEAVKAEYDHTVTSTLV